MTIFCLFAALVHSVNTSIVTMSMSLSEPATTWAAESIYWRRLWSTASIPALWWAFCSLIKRFFLFIIRSRACIFIAWNRSICILGAAWVQSINTSIRAVSIWNTKESPFWAAIGIWSWGPFTFPSFWRTRLLRGSIWLFSFFSLAFFLFYLFFLFFLFFFVLLFFIDGLLFLRLFFIDDLFFFVLDRLYCSICESCLAWKTSILVLHTAMVQSINSAVLFAMPGWDSQKVVRWATVTICRRWPSSTAPVPSFWRASFGFILFFGLTVVFTLQFTVGSLDTALFECINASISAVILGISKPPVFRTASAVSWRRPCHSTPVPPFWWTFTCLCCVCRHP